MPAEARRLLAPVAQAVRPGGPQVAEQGVFEPRMRGAAVQLGARQRGAEQCRTQSGDDADAGHPRLLEGETGEPGGVGAAALQRGVHEVEDRRALTHPHRRRHVGARGRPPVRERRQLLELLGQRSEVAPHGGNEQLHRLGLDRQAQPARVVRRPAADPVGAQAVHLHRRGARGEIRSGVTVALHENQHGGGIGIVEVADELVAGFALRLHLLDAAQHHRAALGDHGGGVHERPERLRVQLSGGAGVHVEVSRRRIHGALEQRPHGFLLQHVLLAMEIVHRAGRGSLLQTLEKRIEREGRHTGRKLPPGDGG